MDGAALELEPELELPEPFEVPGEAVSGLPELPAESDFEVAAADSPDDPADALSAPVVGVSVLVLVFDDEPRESFL